MPTVQILLTKHMFSRSNKQFSLPKYFGMHEGQMRPGHNDCYACGERLYTCKCEIKDIPSCHKMGHNNYWYNKSGEKLGWGDICSCDLNQIAAEMDPTDIFYCLYEQDGHWNLHYDIKTDYTIPGIKYVQSKAHLAVHNKTIYSIADRNSAAERIITIARFNVTVIQRQNFIRISKEAR